MKLNSKNIIFVKKKPNENFILTFINVNFL